MLDDALTRLDFGQPRFEGPADLPTLLREAHTPGIGIALIEDGKVADERYEGFLRHGDDARVNRQTLFQAASISKPVAAACALRLVADGVLDLDRGVDDYLTSWQVPDSGGWRPRVTLRHLLSHTAGTTASGFMGYPEGGRLPTVPEILDGHGNSEAVVVASMPGLRYQYSGGGYTVVQQILTDVTGRDFADLARELVLDPAGMTDSRYVQPIPPDLARNAATGHRAGPDPIAGNGRVYPELAAAGLWSTAGDLARFLLAIRASVHGLPGALLPIEIAAQMTTAVTPHTPYGLGLAIGVLNDKAAIGHNGSNQGFQCDALVTVESGRGYAAMTNGEFGSLVIRDVILPAVERARGTRPAPVESSPAPSDPVRYGQFLIEPDGDGLIVTVDGQAPLTMVAGPDGGWRSEQLHLDLRFDGDALVARTDAGEVRAERTLT